MSEISIKPDWNDRWREKTGEPLTVDSWLLAIAALLPDSGRALDLACGRGRHALFLAERGLTVTALDSSAEALEQLHSEATRRALAIETRQVDLEITPRLPSTGFDVVLLFFYLQRSLLPHLREAVRPGGLAVLRTFSSAGSFPGGPENPDFVLRPGELLETFAGWDILRHEEGLEPSSKGGSLAGIVARRPSQDGPEGRKTVA
ncbi:MAG: methyltransferase domain-containing protein [Desulfuromonadales bacterium]|nr:methyltransferase domain-containing protein [Desulfuromonadales bacterium]